MTDETPLISREARIDELLEKILDTDQTPEQVCSDWPELLGEVQAKLRKLRSVEAQVDSLFPSWEVHADPPISLPLPPNTVLPSIDGYEIKTVLGRGGMGIVYKARHLKLNRDVALKMLLNGRYTSEQDHLRFVREAESVAALRHPNIVQVYDIGDADGHPFYTMEYVDGGSLAEKLVGTIQPARESAKLVRDLAQAVQTAHDCGVVHRDLKPANILLGEESSPKITDFGLARWIDRDSGLTNTGARIGTPSYMAPEQMMGSSTSVGPSVDVFALGAILYEMLTGHPPFRGNTLSDTERKLTTEEPAPPSRFNSKVPRDLETICLKCLEKAPQARYASANDMAADLDRFLRHEPILARPITPAERWVRWIRRNPLPTTLVIASVVLIGLTVSKVLDERAETAAQLAERARLTSRFESAIQLVQAGRFAEASAILGKLGDGGFADLRQRIDRALSDLHLVERLEAISVKRAMALNAHDPTWLPTIRAATEYEALFTSADIGKLTDDPTSVAKRISSSDIKEPLIAALDDWAVCEGDEARRNWVLENARKAGVDKGRWEDQCRDPSTWTDRTVLAKLAETAPIAKASVQQLRALGDRLATAGLDATAFRSRVQAEHVDNFLANLALADALRPADPEEAIRYYQAALAIHPQSATTHNNLAVALTQLGRSDEAIVQYEQALKLDRNSAAIHYNLGVARSKEHPGEAIKHLRQAVEINAKLATAHRALGQLYLQEHQYSDAEASLQACLPMLQDENERRKVLDLIQRCKALRFQSKEK